MLQCLETRKAREPPSAKVRTGLGHMETLGDLATNSFDTKNGADSIGLKKKKGKKSEKS